MGNKIIKTQMKAAVIALFLGAAVAIKSTGDPTAPYNAWESVKDGKDDGKYERVVTSHFSGDSDDIFMRSMIKKYAVELRTDTDELDDGTKIGGEPTGKFWMTQSTALLLPRRFLTPIRDSQVMPLVPT